MTPLKLTRSQAKRLERNLQKPMKGREIAPGVVAHISDDAQPETIDALKELASAVMKMTDGELLELVGGYLKSRKK